MMCSGLQLGTTSSWLPASCLQRQCFSVLHASLCLIWAAGPTTWSAGVRRWHSSKYAA